MAAVKRGSAEERAAQAEARKAYGAKPEPKKKTAKEVRSAAGGLLKAVRVMTAKK